MIARVSFILFTFGLFLGALLLFKKNGAPCPPITIEATGIQKTRNLNPEDILSIDMCCEGILYLAQEEGSPTIRIEADQALMPYITATITDKTLKICREEPKNSVFLTGLPQFFVFVPDIAAICARGTAHIVCHNRLKVDSLDVNTRGSATIELSLETKQLDVQSHGESSVHISGIATEQHIELRGTTRYNALNLETKTSAINASGAFIAVICATELLHGKISGTGILTFDGNPKIFVTQTDKVILQRYSPESTLTHNAQ